MLSPFSATNRSPGRQSRESISTLAISNAPLARPPVAAAMLSAFHSASGSASRGVAGQA